MIKGTAGSLPVTLVRVHKTLNYGCAKPLT